VRLHFENGAAPKGFVDNISLHENDFIMASKIDRMFDRPYGSPDL
jgi:hypothetical protein